jgi:hypothetical protein
MIATSLALSSAAAEARPTPTARTVSSWLLQYHADELRSFPDDNPRYAVAYTDLNGDGVDEAVVYFESRASCGTGGCNMYVLASRAGFWHRVSGHTIVRRPIQVLPTRHLGWRDLSVWVAGGGITEGYHAVLPFDGKTYPLNPSTPPARPLAKAAASRVIINQRTPLVPLVRR